MKKKPLSMKKLYQYAVDFMFYEFENSGMSDKELQKRTDIIKDYLDFIWKNRD
jgi:hypothetical protein